jgi:ethanolaminephosphotransferase
MKVLFSCTQPYVAKEYFDNLRNYKYKSADASITYKYVISPLCNHLVKLFPEWVAPNVITVSGFALNIIYFIVTSCYTKFKAGEVPLWACIFCAFCYLIYQILDNIDGKQARRTNSSSALGLLVDHGTDSCTTFFITCSLGAIIGFDSIKQYTLLWIMIIVPFYLNNWEQYMTGQLSLPCINGINEGTVLLFVVEIAIGIIGQDVFIDNEYEIFGITLQLNTIIGIGFCFSGILFGLVSIIKVLLSKDVENKCTGLIDILPFIYFLSGFFAIVYLSDSKIVENYPQLLFITFGFHFAKMLGLLQLSHLTKARYMPYSVIFLLPNLCFIIHSVIYYFVNEYRILFISIDDLIWFFMGLNFLSWLHFAYFCSEQLCIILGIYRFVLKKRDEEKKLEESDKEENEQKDEKEEKIIDKSTESENKEIDENVENKN